MISYNSRNNITKPWNTYCVEFVQNIFSYIYIYIVFLWFGKLMRRAVENRFLVIVPLKLGLFFKTKFKTYLHKKFTFYHLSIQKPFMFKRRQVLQVRRKHDQRDKSLNTSKTTFIIELDYKIVKICRTS